MPSKDTKIVSARIPKDIDFSVSVSQILKDVHGLLAQGVLKVEDGKISVDTFPVSVDTNITESVDTFDYCKGCEYMENALDMSKFNEVCEFKDLDKQKALDRCAQMLWR